MRAAVVYYAEKQKKYLKELSEALARGIEKQDVSVDVIDAHDYNRRLAIYKLVVIGTEATGNFGGKIPEGLAKFLKTTGPVSNLRSFGFIAKKGFRTQKSLQVLMKTMESEGMFVIYSDVVGSPDEAAAIGEKLIIKS